MLTAIAEGETNPAALASLADERLRATPEQLCDALGACTELNVVYRRLLKMALGECQLIDKQIEQLDKEMASRSASTRMRFGGWRRCPVWEWTRQIIAEVGLPQQPFPRRNVSPRGSVLARVTRRAQA